MVVPLRAIAAGAGSCAVAVANSVALANIFAAADDSTDDLPDDSTVTAAELYGGADDSADHSGDASAGCARAGD